ncbi:MAG: hypothetical protein HQM11_07565 [SAR324 cluster bacterium]|nr:hypothetical protein [SAR324 cluster bacterium]
MLDTQLIELNNQILIDSTHTPEELEDLPTLSTLIQGYQYLEQQTHGLKRNGLKILLFIHHYRTLYFQDPIFERYRDKPFVDFVCEVVMQQSKATAYDDVAIIKMLDKHSAWHVLDSKRSNLIRYLREVVSVRLLSVQRDLLDAVDHISNEELLRIKEADTDNQKKQLVERDRTYRFVAYPNLPVKRRIDEKNKRYEIKGALSFLRALDDLLASVTEEDFQRIVAEYKKY